jgi:hypothetical protein
MRINSGPGSDASRPYLSPARLGLRLGVSVLHGRWCRSSPVGFRHKSTEGLGGASPRSIQGALVVIHSTFSGNINASDGRWVFNPKSDAPQRPCATKMQSNTGDYSMTIAYVNGKYRGVARTPYDDSSLANSQLEPITTELRVSGEARITGRIAGPRQRVIGGRPPSFDPRVRRSRWPVRSS